MKYLLDTNACIELLRGKVGSPVEQRVENADPADLLICSVVKSELIYGIHRSANSLKNASQVQRLFDQFESLFYDDAAASRSGEARAHLAKAGTPMGPNDLLIAGIALANNLVLVTANVSEFRRVPGLIVEDWSQP